MTYLIRRLLHSIGDAVCLEPLITLLNEAIEPDDEIWMQCDERISTLFYGHPLVSKILIATEEAPPDAQVVLNIAESGSCPSIQSLLSGGRVNATQLYCNAVRFKDNPLIYDGRAPKLYFTAEEKETIRLIRQSVSKRKVCVQMQGGHWWKKYHYLKELVKMLRDMDLMVYLSHDQAIPFDTKGVYPLVRLPYRDLLVWLGAMDLYIGFDSGPTHMAAAAGTRTYAMFGPTDPDEIMGMYGKHVSWNAFPAKVCKRGRCWLQPCKGLYCLSTLHPKKLMKDIKNILAEDYENLRLQETVIDTKPKADDVITTVTPTIETPAPIAPSTDVHYSQAAFMRLDGLGGTMTLSDHAKKEYERTGRKPVLITRGYEILFKDNPYVDKVINVGMRDWKETSLMMRNQYDPMGEVRFGIGKWFSNNGHYRTTIAELNQKFGQFPKDFNQLARYGLHHVQLADKTLGLPYDTIESEVFIDKAIDIGLEEFALVNNGVDVIHQGMRQTKCWHKWNELAGMLPIKTVQVGTKNDPPVVGAVDLRGKTDLEELIYLLKKAKAIIVTEGGIMHLSYAAKANNVLILGGPTQGVLFEYPGHNWITSYICGDCWSSTDNWYQRCPKNCNAVCMQTITPHRVTEVVNESLA
jgi:ADP-heptose:LPS heptosyltransferase